MNESTRRTRRDVLGAAAAGAVGLTVGRLAVPQPVSATTGAMQYGADNDAGGDTTILRSSNEFRTLEVHGNGAYAISGEGEGAESTGVVGIGSGPGTGVRGESAAGVGVQAGSTSGRALAVEGRASFLTGGWVSVPSGASSVKVVKPWIRAGSLVVATLQRDRPGTWVRSVIVFDGKMRIYLNRRVSSSAKVAYFVFEPAPVFPD
jgi:hypothetical protein